jgi:restriction system protein
MKDARSLPEETTWQEGICHTLRGVPQHYIAIVHHGLGKARTITDVTYSAAETRAVGQLAAWDEAWQLLKAQMDLDTAGTRTKEAQDLLRSLQGVLHKALSADMWSPLDSLKTPFDVLRPQKPVPEVLPPVSAPPARNPAPGRADPAYDPSVNASLIRRFFLQDRLEAELEERFRSDLEEWRQSEERQEVLHQKAVERVIHSRGLAEERNTRRMEEYEKAIAEWSRRKQEHEDLGNLKIEQLRAQLTSRVRGAVEDFFRATLEHSEYSALFPRELELAYNPQTQVLLIDFALPAPSAMPTLREVVWVKTRKSCTEKHLSSREQNELYDSVLYQTCLRTLYEVMEADVVNCLEAVVFNGWVRENDPSTGKDVNACIMSVQASKEEFLSLELARVEPKACFKALKGVGSSQLHGLAAVAPILRLDREDDRFVEGREVVGRVGAATNLAAMDWEDFEHLIREVFEAEFSRRGGEVKITQASRDRGVDAVVFDPDPISGGKIILQAKRYTNTVGVEAVRDLYGTVINEGANKGILVTTSDYGPDAHKFAADKPLTLLNGGNLLHLLAKHGHQARINLQEAKLQQREQETSRR